MHRTCIIVVSLVCALFTIATMALVTRFFVSKHAKQAPANDKLSTDGNTDQVKQLANISSSWRRIFTPKQDQGKSHWVPSFSGIIKAEDEGLFTSALFANLHGHPSEPSLEALYDAFANTIRSRPMTERSAYPGDMTKFLNRTKKPAIGLARAKSVTFNKRPELSPSRSTKRKSLDLSVMEMGLTRGMSVKRPNQTLVPMRKVLQTEGDQKAIEKSWMKDGHTAKYQEGRMNVKITPTELAALSIILASPVNMEDPSNRKGAYGISITVRHDDAGKNILTLQQHKLSVSRRHAKGSGISSVFAKHLFCGSLPYSLDKVGVHSIAINDETFEAVRSGTALSLHPYVARTPQAKHLESLPSSRVVRPHILSTTTETSSPNVWLDAIAGLPFSGGLAPLASTPLIKTVQFVASAGLTPARLLQRLEGLVDKVHRHSPHLNIFGPLYEPQNAGLLYREQERLGKLAKNPGTHDTLADKTARMSRYTTLIERLMALVPDMKSQDVLTAVQQATAIEIRKSYDQAVAAHTNRSTSAKLPSIESPPRQATTSSWRSRNSNRSSVLSDNTGASEVSSRDFGTENLSTKMEQVLKSELPLDLTTIAFVARMVIVAWTLSVGHVAWDGEAVHGVWMAEDVEKLAGLGKMVVS